MSIWMVSAILIIALILLVTEKTPVDRTAIGIMVALSLSGILTPQEAVSGFANPAVITVAVPKDLAMEVRSIKRMKRVDYLVHASTHAMGSRK